MTKNSLLTNKPSWQEWGYPLILLLLVLSLFHEFFDGDKMLVSLDQVKALGIRTPVHNTLAEEGKLAEWSPGLLGGMPAGDALAGDFMYPPSIILSKLFPQYRVFGYAMIFHIFLAGIFFYMMLRRGFNMPPYIAFIGGVFYMFNPEFFSHIFPGHDGKMFVIAWLPFMVWRVKEVLDRPNLLNASLVSLGIAMALLTSHIQMSYFSMWGLIAYWVFHTGYTIFSEKSVKPVLKTTGFFWLGLFVGLAVGSLQLYPAYMYVHDQWSVRGVDKTPDEMWAHATSWCIHWPEFFSLWIAKFGNWFDYYWSENGLKLNSEYAGAMVVFGALLALIRKPKSYRLFWALFGALMVAFALTFHTPIYKLFYNFAPSVNKMRAASMIMHWFSFVVVMLTALFLKDVNKEFWNSFSDKKMQFWKIGSLAGVALVSIIALVFRNHDFVLNLMSDITGSIGDDAKYMDKTPIFTANFTENFLPALGMWWFMISSSLVLLFLMISGKIKKEVFIWALFAFGLFDLYSINKEFINIKPNRVFKNPNSTFKTLIAKQQMVTNPKKGQKPAAPFRVFFVDKPYADAWRFTDPKAVAAQSKTREKFYTKNIAQNLTAQINEMKAQKNSLGKPLYTEQQILGNIAMSITGDQQSAAQLASMGSETFVSYISGEMAKRQSQVGKSPMELCQNIAGTYGLEGLSGFHDNELKWYRTFRGISDSKLRKDISGTSGRPEVNNMAYPGNRLKIANCKYIVFKGNSGSYQYAENQYALPRLSFTNSYRVVKNDNEADAVLNRAIFDSRVTTLLEEKPSFESAQGVAIDTSISVQWIKYSNSCRAAKISVNSTGILRIAEVYYPGWEITLNGKKVDKEKLLKRDIAWLGLELEQGEYHLEMKPKSLYLGTAKAVAIPLIVLLLLLWGFHTYLYYKKRSSK